MNSNFSNNFASSGGVLYTIDFSTALFESCVMSNNGISFDSVVFPILTIICTPGVQDKGGAVYAISYKDGYPKLVNCSIQSNNATFGK